MTTPGDFTAFPRREHPTLLRLLTVYCGDAGPRAHGEPDLAASDAAAPAP